MRRVIVQIELILAYGRGLLSGISQYSRLHGPWVFYREVGGHHGITPKMQPWGADGIIARVNDTKEGKRFTSLGIPVVAVVTQKQIPDVPRVDTDDAAIGKMAAEHLLERGFRRFAFYGYEGFCWSISRSESFSRTASKAGFDTHFYKQTKVGKSNQKTDEQEQVAKWLMSLPKPVGIMACNDSRARDIIESCKTANIKIPDDVAVIGVDNDDLFCDMCDPPLSSIALNTRKAGYEAAELLEKLMAGKKVKQQVVTVQPTHAVTRQSTDVLAVEDPGVAEALRFIREHAKEAIQVGEVAEAITTSRRSIQRCFHKILGRSVHDEIRRVRVEQVTQMLLETVVPIQQIALELGYSSEANMARAFRQEKGMNPSAYRRKHRY